MREFWVIPSDRVDIGSCYDSEFENTIHVREVSPALDEAYAECEDILQRIAEGRIESAAFAQKALSILKKAKEK